MRNCSRPDAPALLEALRPVLNMSSIRPVRDFSTPIHVFMDFTIYGILGMVRRKSAVLSTLDFLRLLALKETIFPFLGWESPTSNTVYLATLCKYAMCSSILSHFHNALLLAVHACPHCVMMLPSASVWLLIDLLFVYWFITQEWKNEFVSWNPEQCGTSRISVSKKLLWVPDIVINEL